MAKRRKRLKQRLLTYGELDARTLRATKKSRKEVKAGRAQRVSCAVTLYGSVQAKPAGIEKCWFEIQWYGNLRRAGGPDRMATVTLARVYAMSDGDTGYLVTGVGAARKRSKAGEAEVKVWKRYASVFTPFPKGRLLTEGQSAGYRLHDGTVTEWNDTTAHWQTMPTCNRPEPSYWAGGGFTPGQPDKVPYGLYPKFIARCRRFHSDLRKQLADGPQAVVQLLHKDEVRSVFSGLGNALQVCLPPTRTATGRRLIVAAAMHSAESRKHFRIDGDYSPRHSQYYAWDDSQPRSSIMRWKCGKDALVGIKEWVLGSIYIPGPE